MDSLVTTQWLADHLGDPDLVVVDASMHMAATGRDARAEHSAAHIPGALFFDIEALSDHSDPAPHMLPVAAEFGAAMELLGIGRDDRIVVYDDSPLHSATRGWFMLRHFGAAHVAVLDGGLACWRAEGRPLQSSHATRGHAEFDAFHRAHEVVGKADILAGRAPAIIDARGRGRFEGTDPDPRPGVAPGHIPRSRNLPYNQLYSADGRLKDNHSLRQLFADSGIDPAQPFVATCGSGVTATSLIFAAHLLGNDDTRLYDGSWSEYGADPAAPKAVGAA